MVKVDVETVNAQKTDLLQMIKDRNAKVIINIGKTGFFYKCTPDKTLAL